MKTLVMKVNIEECDYETIKAELTEWFAGNGCGMEQFNIKLNKTYIKDQFGD